MRQPSQPGRLVSFTLADVPYTIRMRAARGARDERTGPEAEHPEDRLFAKLLGGSHGDLVAAAVAPSRRRYWISEQAWRAIMG